MSETVLQLHSARKLPPAQATDLAQLVDLEARWENLRIYQPIPAGKAPATLKELHQRQKAYEAFFAKLSAYNKLYRPLHVPEQLLNRAIRLADWCRSMRDLYAQVQGDVPLPCTLHIVEKAYRWADRIADKLNQDRIIRPAAFDAYSSAIRELDDVAEWCMGRVDGTMPQDAGSKVETTQSP